jgi:hypothetical protein
MEFEPKVEAAMKTWLARNPKNKNGLHHYQLEDFGLDAGALEARFKHYRERFEVATEH